MVCPEAHNEVRGRLREAGEVQSYRQCFPHSLSVEECGVSFIDDEEESMLVPQRCKLRHRRYIPIHAENSVCDHQLSAGQWVRSIIPRRCKKILFLRKISISFRIFETTSGRVHGVCIGESVESECGIRTLASGVIDW